MILHDRIYNFLKWISLYAIPGLAILILGLKTTWGFGDVSVILGVLFLFGAGIGALLVLANAYFAPLNPAIFMDELNKYLTPNLEAFASLKKGENTLPNPSSEVTSSSFLSSEWYDKIKWLITYFIPTISATYFAIGQSFDNIYMEQVLVTLTLLETFLSGMIGISAFQYRNNKRNRREGDPLILAE